jgi:hypothetical protein
LFEAEETGGWCADADDRCRIAGFRVNPFIWGARVGHFGDGSATPRVDTRATTSSNKFPEPDSHVQTPLTTLRCFDSVAGLRGASLR